ncbi:glycoside hydrolase family 2 TIM barrel-domain containing protein [Streptomyces coerulescens]|uniref:Beta-galactosidase n=1 Tax=Streptomyces coerulescens TaxID=29304 RepID=A0ABW0CXK9_STRCD
MPIDHTYVESFEAGKGVLAARAWLHDSAKRLSLNGDWAFRLSPSLAEAPDDFDPAGWDSIQVPSHWQLKGYGRPAYTNAAFPFPIEPPHVPTDNPSGDYVRTVEIPDSWAGSRIVLRFEGVDSRFAVRVNGSEVGWSSGSRLPSEFDVTPYVSPGQDAVIAVRVHQWSAGTYLEDQDMWWLSGIFRDVTLLAMQPGSATDVFVQATYEGPGGTLRVESDVPGTVEVSELGLTFPTGRTVAIPQVEPWSAEVPRLYDAVVTTPAGFVTLRVGFRTIAIRDGLLTVNGNRVLFNGVNRHEFHPDRGRALTEQDMLADVLMMKRYGINAVRTSHYPPHPHFLDLCDEYGLYVVDECDLETQGFGEVGPQPDGLYMLDKEELEAHEGGEEAPQPVPALNPVRDPRWREAMVDRIRRTVERDKNHPSIVLWSIANECGMGANLRVMYDWVRDRDPSRPVHYERDHEAEFVDVYSRMYLTTDQVAEIGQDSTSYLGLPFILCEYAHAMGNGPGGLSDYQRLFETYPRCQGGFIWEWIDQGIRTKDDRGREFFGYGGDFGESIHDGNFVCDGLLFPDRTPSPGMLEFAKVIEPVRIMVEAAEITVQNGYEVLDTGHLRFRWVLDNEGAEIDGMLDVPVIKAGESVKLDLPVLPELAPGESWLTIRAELAAPTIWAREGHLVAWGQGRLSTEPDRLPMHAEPKAVDIRGAKGQPLQLAGMPVSNICLDVWRAAIDNDELGSDRVADGWRKRGLHRVQHRIVDVGERVTLVRTAAPDKQWGLLSAWNWTAYSDGSIGLDLAIRPDGAGLPKTLPRLGITFELPRIETVTWFGRGPGEAYPDSQAAAAVGRWTMTVDELQTPYVRPQENGHRAGTRWAELVGADGTGLRIESAPTLFGLTVRHWSTQAVDEAKHPNELLAGDTTYVTLDIAHAGVNWTGPVLPERYQVRPGKASLSLRFRSC